MWSWFVDTLRAYPELALTQTSDPKQVQQMFDTY